LALGSDEVSPRPTFAATDLTGVSLANVSVCPNGDTPADTSNCAGQAILPASPMPEPPIACVVDMNRGAVALDDCPTPTSPLGGNPSAFSGIKPLAVVGAAPPVWATNVTAGGSYVGLEDGTVRLVDSNISHIVAGTSDVHCATPTEPCGDGGAATGAQLGLPAGLAVGRDGSWYIADPDLHRVRKVDHSQNISTVAGSGEGCAVSTDACGDGGLATAAALSGPTGVWVDPVGNIWIADGLRGIRHVLPDGTITSLELGSGPYDIQSVVGDATGHVYATTTRPGDATYPDYLLQVDPRSGQVDRVVGTGTSGYNGSADSDGDPLPGNQVQVNQPVGLSLRLDGDVLFADTGNHLARAYVPTQGTVIELGGLVAGGTPQGGSNGTGHWADQTELNHPLGLSTMANSRYLIVVADTDNELVRLLGPVPEDESQVPAASSPTGVPTPTSTAAADSTPTPTPTVTPTGASTPAATPSATPISSATATPTESATMEPTPTDTVRPNETPTSSPAGTATPDATATQSSVTPRPTPRPSATAVR
jgi:hypothetical protein